MTADNSIERSPAVLLALEFYRDPMALRGWLARSAGLPQGVGELLRLAGAKEDGLQSVAAGYRVNTQELGDATRFFLQQVLLAPDADHYRVLGVERDADSAVVRAQHRLLMRLFHPDRHAGQECWTDAYASRVNQAYNVLRRPESRSRYDQAQSQTVVVSGARVVEENPALRRREFGRGGVSWPDHEQFSADIVPANRRVRPRTLLLAVLILLLVVAVPGWLMRSNQTAVMNSNYVGLDAASPAVQHGQASRESMPPQRENGIPVPRLTALGLMGDGGSRTVALVPSPPSPSIQPPEADQPVQSRPSATIPRSRNSVASSIERNRPAMVIPPPRAVDVPVPHDIPLPPARGGVGLPETGGDRLAAKAPPRSSNNDQAAVVSASEQNVPALSKQSVAVLPAVPASAPREEHARTGLHGAGERQIQLPQPLVALESRDLPITEMALMSMLGHLVSSYQRGDLVGFVGLFSNRASTTDEASLGEIEQQYRHLFSTTKVRRLQVSGLVWQRHASGAQGEGYMVIQIWRAGSEMERYEGRFTVHVTREQRQLRISGLFYDLERA